MLILAADIGGTNSRFALFEKNPLHMVYQHTLSSHADSFITIINRLMEHSSFSKLQVDLVVLAIAGPIHTQTYVKPSNLPYHIAKEDLLPFSNHVLFINDFEAQAWACLTIALSHALQVLPDSSKHPTKNISTFSFDQLGGRLGIIGAGTGLGMSVLEPISNTKTKVLASEGGHTPFPFITQKEINFGTFVCSKKKSAYAKIDDILSGSGLSLLHMFLTGEKNQPEEITKTTNFFISETCTYFSRFYARICRSLTLFNLTDQGIVITGGLAAAYPGLIQHNEFKKEFINIKGEHKKMLTHIPVWINCNHTSGLWGAARAGIEYYNALLK